MATRAACLISGGAAKSGNPCARFTAPYIIACRVISRITDSVKCETLSLRNCFAGWDKEEIESAISGRLAQEELPIANSRLPKEYPGPPVETLLATSSRPRQDAR